MRKFALVAAMLMASASAHAGSFNFNVEGHKVRVNIPRGCASLSCINISAPTITEKFKDTEEVATPASAPAAAAATPAAPAQATATVPQAAPAATPPSSNKVTVLPAPVEPGTNAPAPVASVPPLTAPDPAAATPAPAPVASHPVTPAPVQVAAAPAASAAPAPAPTPQAVATPVGLWMSEKKEGKIRIEDCGGNLCGYAVDARSGANGAKVLINMKARGSKWAGRIKDTRSGSVYDSTIALRSNDKLRVQGCAFGGMFCGGETWTRIQ